MNCDHKKEAAGARGGTVQDGTRLPGCRACGLHVTDVCLWHGLASLDTVDGIGNVGIQAVDRVVLGQPNLVEREEACGEP
jgi:hypothetical protein